MAWKKGQCCHALLGTLTLLLTTSMALFAWKTNKWVIKTKYNHYYFAYPTFLSLPIIMIFGCTTKCNSLSGKWNTKRSLRNKCIHKFLGYSLIIVGQASVFTGTRVYRVGQSMSTPYEWI